MQTNQKGLSKLKIKTKGIVHYLSINWLTQNQHRIKINVLMASVCTDWGLNTNRLGGVQGVRNC